MGKREDFIRLSASGGSRQDYIDLANFYKRKSMQGVLNPFKELTIFDMLQSGALPSELKHGGIASLAPRRGRVTHPGGYAGDSPAILDVLKSAVDKDTWLQFIDLMSGNKWDLYPDPTEWGKLVGEEKAQGGLAGILNLS